MNKSVIWLIYALLLICCISSCSVAFAINSHKYKDKINILTWWGYLNYPDLINVAEKKCNVEISFDQYYSNDEFLRRWEGQNDYYDLIIFSSTIYNSLKNKIPHLKNSTLSNQSAFYNPTIKSHYINSKYPPNVVYFFHAISGFLWNPSNLSLTVDDSITTIFKKAKNNYVVILDDPFDVSKLIKASLKTKNRNIDDNKVLSISNLKEMTQASNVYITNNFSQIYGKKEFAFSFGWSGEAIVDLIGSNKEYKFLIHPKLSYISSDLIAQTSNKQSSLCVAKYLTSKDAISFLQKKNYYFSPYANHSNEKNPTFKLINKNFYMNLPHLLWSDSMNSKDFQEINQSWQLVKLSLNNHIDGE